MGSPFYKANSAKPAAKEKTPKLTASSGKAAAGKAAAGKAAAGKAAPPRKRVRVDCEESDSESEESDEVEESDDEEDEPLASRVKPKSRAAPLKKGKVSK